MSHALSSTDATRTTRLTQAAAAVLLVAGVALATVGLPERDAPAGRVPSALTGSGQPAEPGSDGITPVAFARVDSEGVAARLSQLDNAPTIVPTEPSTPTTETPEPSEPEGDPVYDAVSDRVRYMGMMQNGQHRAALARVDGRQRIVREGATIAPPADQPDLPPLTFNRVTPNQIFVADDTGTNTIIRIAPRTGPSITLVDGGSVESPLASPDAEATSDEDRQALRDRNRRTQLNAESSNPGENPISNMRNRFVRPDGERPARTIPRPRQQD